MDTVRKFKKRDLLILVIIAAALAIFAAVFYTREKPEGGTVTVTVSGKEYGTYDLTKDQEIPIIIAGKETNHLIIKDCKADVTEADCPDQICVDQKSISKEGETIVCLPNKVVIEVKGADASDFDTMTK